MLSGCVPITKDKHNAENLPRAIVGHFETSTNQKATNFFFSNDQDISNTFITKSFFVDIQIVPSQESI